MQITKKQLKQLISEEVENISEETARFEQLVESYVTETGGDSDSVPKQAIIDLLEVLDEETISRDAFDYLVESLNNEKISELLSEVVEAKEE
jgi:hypothetical protein